MKFRVKRPNQYQKRHWAKNEVHPFSSKDVEEAIDEGRHPNTNKPMSSLLNHWEATDAEAEAAVADFIKAGRNGDRKAPEEAADEKPFDLIARIKSAKTPEALSDMVQPGETRKSVQNAFNARAAELGKQNDDPETSMDTTAAKAVKHIENLQTVEAIAEFAQGDDRATVMKAASVITKKLGG